MSDKPLTRAQRKLLDASAFIFGEGMTPKVAAFMARQLVQASLPHRNPGNMPAWNRTNGHLTLTIRPGRDHKQDQPLGYPYGTIPRLLLFWIATEAVKTKNRQLELGSSLSAFMAELGLSSATGRGKRGDARR